MPSKEEISSLFPTSINNTLKPAEAHLNGVKVRVCGSYALIFLYLNIAAIDSILNLLLSYCEKVVKSMIKML